MPGRVFGHALVSVAAAIGLDDFRVRGAETCGVFVSPDPTLAEVGPVASAPPSVDLRNGVVEQSAIGACVQVDGYDLSRLNQGVEYRDNGTNLETTSLPVPGQVELPEL